MPGNGDTLVVIKRLPYAPDNLERQSGSFLEAVRETVCAVREARSNETLELAEIGFVPRCGFVELRLYFREPALAGTVS